MVVNGNENQAAATSLDLSCLAMRFEGILKTWNDDRGFGFIEPTQGGQDIFIHVKTLPRGAGRPQIGQRVSFQVELGPQGKKRAHSVELLRCARTSPGKRRNSPAQWGTATLFVIPLFMVAYLAAAVLWRPPAWFALGYVAASVVTFMAYAFDKAAAARGARRIPESTLHGLALAAGWPGALLAQQFLRHKSAKAEFRSVFWGTVVVNAAAFLTLCSPLGRSLWAAH
jgi:uncharacterized membrane protein YsdA (DUF1294 family)/cold shock CspA family protein